MAHPLRTHLETVATTLRSDAMAPRVMGLWDDPTSRPKASIGPRASAVDLRRLSATLGGPLPESLREVLQEVSAEITIAWAMRGHYEDASWGRQVVTDVTPPSPFMQWDRAPQADGTMAPGAVKRPVFISGGLRFSMAQLESMLTAVPDWQAVYADHPQDDADLRDHYNLIRDFMGAGLPVMRAGNGDWLAIDQRDTTECLLHVSHEGEVAGMELDLTLPNFIAHQSWLGPITPDFTELGLFSSAQRDVVDGDYRVTEITFDATSDTGRIWRDWFWGDAGLPAPDPSLLARCG